MIPALNMALCRLTDLSSRHAWKLIAKASINFSRLSASLLASSCWGLDWPIRSAFLAHFPRRLARMWCLFGFCFRQIFFWVDWVAFSDELTTDGLRDFAKHTHDLGRNIWIAFAGILAYLFNIHLGVGGT